MSSKLIKTPNPLALPGDDTVVASIQVTQSGKIMVHAPTVHPRELIKLLQNLIMDLIYNSFQAHVLPQIETPPTGMEVPKNLQ